jgi:hypothetical protein
MATCILGKQRTSEEEGVYIRHLWVHGRTRHRMMALTFWYSNTFDDVEDFKFMIRRAFVLSHSS